MFEHHNIVVKVPLSVSRDFETIRNYGGEYSRLLRYFNFTQHTDENANNQYIISASPTAWTKFWEFYNKEQSFNIYNEFSPEKLCKFLHETFPLLVLKPENTKDQNRLFPYKGKVAEIMTETEIDALPYEVKRHHKMVTAFFVCDRGVSHELVRHRNSFAQESTRYVNYGKSGCQFILPCWINHGDGEYDVKWQKCQGDQSIDPYPKGSADSWWFWGCAHAERVYLKLLDEGQNPQQARSVLPNSVKTEVYMSCTLAYWEWFFKMRDADAAHPQMRELAAPLHREFIEKNLLITE